ncbi:Conserved_hypothetical protein [Hexamita inflata]|uniref:Uncharacterized protein n=1 Tax=Hexamita inflata TaxID=28002 RepID=A0AA86NCF2_9EUKA|nr:Conserved hypothetical protein [Hexamita inflata]
MIYLLEENTDVKLFLESKNIKYELLLLQTVQNQDKIIFQCREQIHKLLEKYNYDQLILLPKIIENLSASLEKQPILVSNCLLGINCRYDGQSKQQNIDIPFNSFHHIGFCPEEVKLTTPRPSAGFYTVNGVLKILQNSSKLDVTYEFEEGAKECLKLCDAYGIWFGIMKKNSPSCGVLNTYIDGKIQNGSGLTSALLLKHGLILKDSFE